MNKLLLVRFGDLMLKGDNRKMFLDKVNSSIKEKLEGLDVVINRQHDRVFLEFDEKIEEMVLKKLSFVSGLYSFSFVYKSSDNLEDVANLAIKMLKEEVKEPITFKVETKRANKNYYLTSQDFSKAIAPLILKEVGDLLKVDVKNPKLTLTIELRNDGAYLFTSDIKAMGGFPMGTGGKALLMMSGGIDSPVAAYLMMKQGIELELLHFESTPLTPLESVQKVLDLAKILANYQPKNQIKLHLVPFLNIHQNILKNVNDSYVITILRRHMYRFAERFSAIRKAKALANGESLGQVASQTLDSINVVENVTNIPILRPLITYDKNDIIKISRKIETYDISIRPFNDCCSIYVPKHPVTHPKVFLAKEYEEKFNYNELIEEAISKTITINVTVDLDFKIYEHGFEVSEAINNFFGENKK
ncbi:tRNA 4-thiouridine(8) synthase ThiI [Acholeplasma sp. OttesenSCG-928-E16]|nr:tRNA 4-thiouridine(8) synthase ThiI [Acholeplasma sp. OttesenSCG-928-E16]